MNFQKSSYNILCSPFFSLIMFFVCIVLIWGFLKSSILNVFLCDLM